MARECLIQSDYTQKGEAYAKGVRSGTEYTLQNCQVLGTEQTD